MVAEHLCLVRKVVGVHANAVTADQAGSEWQKVPFRSGRLEDLEGIDADAVEDDRKLVDQRDIQVSLGVLDDFGGFGDLDAGSAVHPGGHHRAIELGDALECFRSIAGDDLHDRRKRVLLVAGVDALWRVADVKVREPFHPGIPLQDRNADFFSSTRVDCGFIHHDRTVFHVLADGGARTNQRSKVRLAHRVYRCGNGDHDDIGGGKMRRIGRYREPGCGTQLLA